MSARRTIGWIFIGVALVSAALAPAQARMRRGVESDSGGVPFLDVKGSCSDAQKFSSGADKTIAFKSCLQSEMNAKSELGKRWSSFKDKDKSNCVEQSRYPSPSYVEVLTCLEMSSGAMGTMQRVDGRSMPQIGGPVAPGLSASPDPTLPK